MHKFCIIFVTTVLISFIVLPTIAIDPTCRGKRVNERCACDEDCEGFNIQCVQGKCVCPFNFDSVQLTDKYTLCRPAPKAVGGTCNTACIAPLLCQNGKCVCFGPGSSTGAGGQCIVKCPNGQTLVGQDCRVVAAIGAACSADQDCSAANSYCNRGKCDCIPGSTKSGASCTLNCPDGTAPTQSCSKIMVNDANALANGEKQDSCPKGYGCATYGKPDIGHCCKLYCPYGSPDLTKSCEAGAGSNKCPDTHYCQSFEDRGTKNSLCCPSPCREPTPLFVGGKCLHKAHWNDACKEDGQCEGGSSMQCKGGVCACRQGFAQVNNTFAQCQKVCNILTQTNVEGNCNTKVSVDNPCISSGQCPSRSICREGICGCDCSSALSKNSCIDPDDPGGTNKLTEVITSILSPSGGGGTGK